MGERDGESRGVPPWDLIERVPLGDYKVFRVRKDVARSPRTGRPHDFFVLEGSDWVNVIALTRGGEIVLVRQYRLGTWSESLEIPGGCTEPHDGSALVSAQRELLEETGFGGGAWTFLGAVQPNPAVQTNTCTTFLAEGVERVAEPAPDAGEDIRVEVHPTAALAGLVKGGEIRHALVLAAFHWWELSKR